MASVRESMEVLAQVTGEPPAFIRGVSRTLLDADLIPRSVGKRIYQVQPRDLALMLLAIYTAPRVRAAAEPAQHYWQLRPRGIYALEDMPEKAKQEIAELPRAGDMLAATIEALQDEDAPSVEFYTGHQVSAGRLQIEIVQSWPEIVFSAPDVKDATNEPFKLRYLEAGKSEHFWQSNQPRKAVTIPGITLFNMVRGLKRLDDET